MRTKPRILLDAGWHLWYIGSMLKHSIICAAACGLALATESFEDLPQGAIAEGEVHYGALSAEKGHAEIMLGKGRTGDKALRLAGGDNRQAEIVLDVPLAKEAPCDFWLQRWTRAEPFEFSFSAVTPEGVKPLFKETKMGVGGYHKHVQVHLPAGATAVRFACTSPDKTGALVDDFAIHSGPMAIKSVSSVNPGAYPLLKRARINPAFAVHVQATGSESPLALDSVQFKLDSPESVESVTLRSGNAEGTNFRGSTVYGTAKPAADGTVNIACGKPLAHGNTWLWADVQLADKAKVGGKVAFSQISAKVGGKSYDLSAEAGAKPVTQRIGYLLSVPGENVGQLDGTQRPCVAFRIPGMIRTDKGTLVGVFDARYRHAGDLCADIDVAMVRSTDGGQTWSLPTVAMDAGPGDANGCGDPCIVQDRNGRIWVQALSCHFKGGASLGVSKKGFDPASTGQWEMTYSDDDGKTWAKTHVNPTNEIKKDEWHCILAGPGNGITMADGTIVFPAQIWQRDAKINCMSTICYSKDGGKTWKYGAGVPHRTSECQAVQLRDGSLMLNCRNEARSGRRVVYVTKDLGETWEPHETNLEALEEPTCQASLIKAAVPKARTTGRVSILLFSNPKSMRGRNHMTVRYSANDGKSWSEGLEYDARGCWGYSCITPIDKDHIGVMYEAPHVSEQSEMHGIGFVILPIEEVRQAK